MKQPTARHLAWFNKKIAETAAIPMPSLEAQLAQISALQYNVDEPNMKIPKELDAVDVLLAVGSLCSKTSLRHVGLTRHQYRQSKKAQDWFLGEIVKAVQARKKRIRGR